MAGMTKARYVMIAETIAASREACLAPPNTDAAATEAILHSFEQLTSDLADALQADNPQFRRGWFMAIAGAVYCEKCGARLDSYGTSLDNPGKDAALCSENLHNGVQGKHVPSEKL